MPKKLLMLGALLSATCLLQVLPVAASTNKTKLVLVTRAKMPVDIATRVNDSALYIAEQDGLVQRFVQGKKTIALDLRKRTSASGERGLLGIVFHPNGKYMYVNYTNQQGNTEVARYAMTATNTANVSTRTLLLTVKQPYANHNGGGLAFGPEGRLYVGTGDGGSGGDPERVALKISSPLGKILSLSPTAKSQKTNDLVVWSRGLRNPWRFEFDSSNNLWIADVGQNMWEEVNVAWAAKGSGKNVSFGWSAWEGNTRYNTDEPAKSHQKPVFTYQHGDAGCSISGGTRVRDPQLPAWKDWFIFGDYCSGRITAIWVNGQTTQKQTVIQRDVGSITAVRSTTQGKVFVLTLDGKVLQLTQG
jgi:glucose/arabinose dehydrogenase